MKKILFILTVVVLPAALATMACNHEAKNPSAHEKTQTADTTQAIEVHPIIQNIFYNLPLEKPRLDLREAIINDKRFILTDTTFNNYPPATFFKGITADKGLIKSKPDSIQVMLVYGNAALVTEKGGQEDSTKHPMILECKYSFSNKDIAEMEYGRILNILQPIFTDTSSIMDDNWEAQFSNSTEKCVGKIFDHFDPYYRVAVSYITAKPIDGSKPVYVLNIAFSKEDKKI